MSVVKTKNILNLYKEVGETPLQRVERFRANNPEYYWEKFTYAGRLDPLAEGVLLTLSGSECKEKEKYLKMDKEYEFDVIFGVKTDTYDILGKIICKCDIEDKILEEIIEKLPQFKGRIKQEYPPFSSKTVLGKPLFEWAKEGRSNEISIPSKDIEIYDISVLKSFCVPATDIFEKIEKSFSRVYGDFRQEKVINSWKSEIKENKKFFALKIKISCSSGTYVRELAFRLSQSIGVYGAIFSIKRNKIGEFKKLRDNDNSSSIGKFNVEFDIKNSIR